MDSPLRDDCKPVPIPPSSPPEIVREAFPGFALPETALHSIPLPQDFEQLLRQAVKENKVKTFLPKYFNPIFRRQGVVNKLALNALESVGHSLSRLAGEIEGRDDVLEKLVRHVNAQNAHTHRQQLALAQLGVEIGRVVTEIKEAIKREEERGRDAEARLLNHFKTADARKRRHDGAALSALRVLDRQIANLQATIDGAGMVARQRIEDQDRRFEETFAASQDALKKAESKMEEKILALNASGKAFDRRLMEAADATSRLFDAIHAELLRLHTAADIREAEARGEIAELRTRLEKAERHSAETRERCDRLEAALARFTEDGRLQHAQTAAAITSSSSKAATLIDAVTTAGRVVDLKLSETERQVGELRAELQALAVLNRDLTRRIEALAALQGSTAAEQLPLLRALRTRLEDGSPSPTSTAGDANETIRQIELTLDDAFYVALENRFRGSRKAIRERLAHYLPEVEAARERIAGLPQEPTTGEVPHPLFSDEGFNVLDLGCGRGEWLRLLGESQVPALGIDTNKHFLAECTKAGAQAVLCDLFEYLHSLPDACVGAITCFHVIEHLGISKIRELFHQSYRVLRRGGLAIFETPNAGNLVTSSLNFHLDPTHNKPVHPLLARFVAESAGFSPVRIEFLHPNEEGLKSIASENPTIRLLGDFLFGPQDFALVAAKP